MRGESLIYCSESMPNLSVGGSLLGICAGHGNDGKCRQGISISAASLHSSALVSAVQHYRLHCVSPWADDGSNVAVV